MLLFLFLKARYMVSVRKPGLIGNIFNNFQPRDKAHKYTKFYQNISNLATDSLNTMRQTGRWTKGQTSLNWLTKWFWSDRYTKKLRISQVLLGFAHIRINLIYSYNTSAAGYNNTPTDKYSKSFLLLLFSEYLKKILISQWNSKFFCSLLNMKLT